jgi:hypothetical protein
MLISCLHAFDIGARERGELSDTDEMMLQKLWFDSTQNATYKNVYQRLVTARRNGYVGTMREWPIQGLRLSDLFQKVKNRPNSVEFIKRAELDGTLFTSTEWSENKLNDNSYVMTSYREEGSDVQTISVGRIHCMFVAVMFEGAQEEVVVAGDWYDVVGTNPVSKNLQVRYNPNFATENMAFLRTCKPKNFTLAPSNPFEDVVEVNRLYDIIDDYYDE